MANKKPSTKAVKTNPKKQAIKTATLAAIFSAGKK
jgi:hypothetical protein